MRLAGRLDAKSAALSSPDSLSNSPILRLEGATAQGCGVTTGMKYNKLLLMAAVCVTTAIAPLPAKAQTGAGGGATTTQGTDDRGDHTNYGWLGLVGLLGLAGLMKKRHDDHRIDATGTRAR
jgi:MYXO-CTERM domain-containing protein